MYTIEIVRPLAEQTNGIYLEHTAAMIAAQSDFVLLDEQRVAFESVLAEARDGYHDAKKSVVLVQGGPGTGKTVVALHRAAWLVYNDRRITADRMGLLPAEFPVVERLGQQSRARLDS